MKARSPFESPRFLWIFSIAFLLLWFYMLGARTLVPTDEGRYAEMAREMVASGDWITPRLNGIKYFEKPPLQNWMNALSFELFGLGEWQARLWTGLCGLLGIGLVGYTGATVFSRRTGIIAALVLGSSFYWAGMGHINTLDMGLAGMMTLALCGLLLAQRPDASEREQRNAMLLCWAGMALATLSKGLPGIVLPGAVLVLYAPLARDWAIWKRLHLLKGLLLFFAITVPWFILVWQKNPEHPYFFFVHEHLQRFTSTVHKRGGPWYYFFPILALIVPWLGLLPQGLRTGWNSDRRTGFQPEKMLLIWSVFIFFFFSVSGSKLPSYILPIFPALALLIACQLERGGRRSLKIAGGLFALIGLLGLAFVQQAAALGKLAYEIPLYQAYAPWLYAAGGVTVLGGGLAWYCAHTANQDNARRDWAIVVLAAAGFVAGQIALLGHEPWGRYLAGVEHVPAIQAELKQPDTPIYAVGRYEQALPFYLRHTVILVEHADEMEFGLQQQPELWIARREDFITQWQARQNQGQPALAILRTDIYAELKQQNFPMRVIAQDPKRVIVANLTNTPFAK